MRLVRFFRLSGRLSLLATIRLTLRRIVNTCTVTILSGGGPSRVVTTHGDDPLIMKVKGSRFFLTSSTAPVMRCASGIICLRSKRVTIVHESGTLRIIGLSGILRGPRMHAIRVGLKRLRGKKCPRFVLGRVFRRPSYVGSYVHKHVGTSNSGMMLSTIVSRGRHLLGTHHFMVITYKAS